MSAKPVQLLFSRHTGLPSSVLLTSADAVSLAWNLPPTWRLPDPGPITESDFVVQWGWSQTSYSGTSVWSSSLIPSKTRDQCPNPWVSSKWRVMKHFLLWGGHVTHTNSSKCHKPWASAECGNIFFSCQNAMSTRSDEFWSQRAARDDCTGVLLKFLRAALIDDSL